ncbi:MAG: MFS transporter [Deltaproteobacteria bacterium]|nr:MFS transporter [Deltaproteobacteria bacterium]
METDTHKSFAIFLTVWSGQWVSAIGSGLSAFVLGAYAFQQTHSASVYSLILLSTFLPLFLLQPLGGLLADRFNRRAMMMVGDLGAASGIGMLVLMMSEGNVEIWKLMIGLSVSSVFLALQQPAYNAAVTDMLPEELFMKASGLRQLAGASPFLISPLLAAALLGVMDIQSILIIDMLTFLAAIGAVLVVRKTPSRQTKNAFNQNWGKELWDGFRYIASNRGLLILLVLISLVNFYVGFLQSLFGPMILAFTNTQALGMATSISAAGMLVGGAVIGMWGRNQHAKKVLAVSLGCTGLFYALIGVTNNLVLIVIPGFLFFFTLPFVNGSLDVLIRGNVDNNKQGRVWSLVGMISQFGLLLAFSLSGFLADKVFNPLLMPGGPLAATVGKVIGTGVGRGIGFMFVISGLFVILLALAIGRVRSMDNLGKENHTGLIGGLAPVSSAN